MTSRWINDLKESESRLHKERVLTLALESAKSGDESADIFLRLCRDCYNPYVTYGIKQVPTRFFEGPEENENPWMDFIELLNRLSLRELTGNAGRDAIEQISERFDAIEWNDFCAPVLKRDLRAGISSTTVNKICKKTPYQIPVFACQLATNSEGRPELTGNMRVEPKLDGVRVILVHDPAKGTVCYSRNGKVFENFKDIEEQVVRLVQSITDNAFSSIIDLKNNGFVLDGEVTGQSFQELMRQARRKENVNAGDSVFNIFDILPLSDFQKGQWNVPLISRIELLDSLRPFLAHVPNLDIVMGSYIEVDTVSGKKELEEYANAQIEAGYEGIMIKRLDSPYECKRTTSWLKYKPVYDYDLTVIGAEEGTGRNKGRLGALICSGEDCGKRIIVNVGSGYSDEERKEYWDNKEEILGRTAVVLADAITKNQNGTYSLRFPRFNSFRYDK